MELPKLLPKIWGFREINWFILVVGPMMLGKIILYMKNWGIFIFAEKLIKKAHTPAVLTKGNGKLLYFYMYINIDYTTKC